MCSAGRGSLSQPDNLLLAIRDSSASRIHRAIPSKPDPTIIRFASIADRGHALRSHSACDRIRQEILLLAKGGVP